MWDVGRCSSAFTDQAVARMPGKKSSRGQEPQRHATRAVDPCALTAACFLAVLHFDHPRSFQPRAVNRSVASSSPTQGWSE